MFAVGTSYTREEIGAELGGSLQSYLPTKDSRVLCGCFNPATNPHAPRIILPGTGKLIEASARLLAQQQEPIPVFVKRAVNDWVYEGMFGVDRWSCDLVDIRANSGARGDVTSVLWLRRVA